MTFKEMVNRILVKLGNRPNLQGRVEEKAEYVKEFTLEGDPEFAPWFLLSEDETIATVASQTYVDLPLDFISEDEFGFLYNQSGVEMRKETYDLLRRRNTIGDGSDDQAAGEPTRYAIKGTRLYLFPIPDAVYTLEISYFQNTGTLANGLAPNWLRFGGDWLLEQTAFEMAVDLQNSAKVKELGATSNRARARVLAKHFEEMAKNMDGQV